MNPTSRICDRLALVLSVILGAWFLYSGGEKVFVRGLERFLQDVANYRMVGAPWDVMVAYGVPWLEIIAGACLMLQVLKRGALVVITGLVLVFSAAVGWAWAHHLKIACGCRGGDEPIHYWGKTVEFAVYFAVLGFLFFVEFRQTRCLQSEGSEQGSESEWNEDDPTDIFS